MELTPQTVEIERELTGRTTAYRWAEVRPEVSGILKELCFTEGAMVKEGDVLYRIEPDTYKAALNKARADLASAEANLKVTRLRERRTADMLRGKSVSQQDYDDVKAALQQAPGPRYSPARLPWKRRKSTTAVLKSAPRSAAASPSAISP